MIVIHSMKTLPGLVGAALSERIRVMPAVVVTGARQTGKSTLVEHLIPGERRYATLDDLDVLDAARRDPEVLVGGPGPVTLDEVQREPNLLRAVKRAIDRDRTPGRFLLTGSANLLLMRQVSESFSPRRLSNAGAGTQFGFCERAVFDRGPRPVGAGNAEPPPGRESARGAGDQAGDPRGGLEQPLDQCPFAQNRSFAQRKDLPERADAVAKFLGLGPAWQSERAEAAPRFSRSFRNRFYSNMPHRSIQLAEVLDILLNSTGACGREFQTN